MAYKIITQPSVEPVTLEYVKARSRIDGAEFDDVIPSLIADAREVAEHKTGCALCSQVWELYLDAFPESFELRPAPVINVVSIKYLDTAGVEQTLDPQDTILDNKSNVMPGYITPAYGKAWPDTYPVPNAVTVRFTAGYGDAGSVPQSAKEWIVCNVQASLDSSGIFVKGNVSAIPGRFIDGKLDALLVP